MPAPVQIATQMSASPWISLQIARMSRASSWSIAFSRSGLFSVTVATCASRSTSNSVCVYGMAMASFRGRPSYRTGSCGRSAAAAAERYRRALNAGRRRLAPKPAVRGRRSCRCRARRHDLDLLAVRRDARQLPAEPALDLAPLRQVGRAEQRDRAAGAAHAARAADAVREQLVRLRQLEVDDARDVQHVEAARRDVRREQDRRLARAEASRARGRAAPWLRLPCSTSTS